MKRLTILLMLIPAFSFAQVEITLNHNQPPELGYELPNHDTTIVIGASVELASGLYIYGGSGSYSSLWSEGTSLSDSTIYNPIATPTDTTTYQLTITDSNGCSLTIDYTVNTRDPFESADQIDDTNEKNLQIYPNPNRGAFTLTGNGFEGEKLHVIFYNSSGNEIYRCRLSTINTEFSEVFDMNLAPGSYFMKATSENHEIHIKFIVN